jgi:hypothetical protein
LEGYSPPAATAGAQTVPYSAAFHSARALITRAKASPRRWERLRLFDDALQRLVTEAADAGRSRIAAGPAGEPVVLVEALHITLTVLVGRKRSRAGGDRRTVK